MTCGSAADRVGRVIRSFIDIRLEPLAADDARAAVAAHHRGMPFAGDFFMAQH